MDKFIINEDESKREETLNKNLEVSCQIARNNFNKFGYLVPVAIFFDTFGNFVNILDLTNLMNNKSNCATFIKMACSNPFIGGIALVSEAWAYSSKAKNDHIMTQLATGEIKVSELRDEDKQEIISVMFEDIDERSIGIKMVIDRKIDPPVVKDAEKLASKIKRDKLSSMSLFYDFFGTVEERAKRFEEYKSVIARLERGSMN